ncbi:MAG: hypothetical protein GY820_07620, partial [Gammaproteobacteria bacterium]|nr:hypothetical protein [Gammaproteobacteria bacterium]
MPTEDGGDKSKLSELNRTIDAVTTERNTATAERNELAQQNQEKEAEIARLKTQLGNAQKVVEEEKRARSLMTQSAETSVKVVDTGAQASTADGTQGLINASQNTLPLTGGSILAPTNASRVVNNSTPLPQRGGIARGGSRGSYTHGPRPRMEFYRGGGRQLPHQITFQDPIVQSEHYVEGEDEYVDPYHEEDAQRYHQTNTGDFNSTVPQFNQTTAGTSRPQTPYQPRPQNQRTEYRKIPTNLCPRFGERYNARDFNTFEREFCQICTLYAVPNNEKLTRFMLHLEGAIQNHAQCYIDNNEREVTYADLVIELRRSFQRKVDVDEAENQLHGRKWNPYEITIDEFL